MREQGLSSCRPDVLGSLVAAPFVLVPVLLWFLPRLGCAVGAVAAVAGAVAQPSPAGLAASLLFGLACVGVLVVLMRTSSDVSRSLGVAAGRCRRRLPPELPSPELTVRPLVAVLLAGLSLVAAVGFIQSSVGDPIGPRWWLVACVGGFLAALLVAWREITVWLWIHRARRRDLPTVRVLVDRSEALLTTRANLYPVDARLDETPFATLDAVPAPRPGPPADEVEVTDPDVLVRVWRRDPGEFTVQGLDPGLLIGDLSAGGLAVVVVGNDLLWPFGSLRTPKEPPSWWSGDSSSWEEDEADAATARAASAGAASDTLPVLPLVRRPPVRSRLISWLLVVAFMGFALGWIPLAWFDGEAFGPALFGIVIGTGFAEVAWSRSSQRLIVDESGLGFHETFYVHRVPWASLASVRLDSAEDLTVTWRPDDTLSLGYLADAPYLMRTIEALRRQHPHRTGQSPPVATVRLRPTAFILPLIGLVLAAVLAVGAAAF